MTTVRNVNSAKNVFNNNNLHCFDLTYCSNVVRLFLVCADQTTDERDARFRQSHGSYDTPRNHALTSLHAASLRAQGTSSAIQLVLVHLIKVKRTSRVCLQLIQHLKM